MASSKDTQDQRRDGAETVRQIRDESRARDDDSNKESK